MGNVCDRHDRVEKHGNKARKSTYDAIKVWVDSELNNNSKDLRPIWVDYKAIKEDINDIGVDCFEDETISHNKGFQHPRNHMDFRNKTRGQFG